MSHYGIQNKVVGEKRNFFCMSCYSVNHWDPMLCFVSADPGSMEATPGIWMVSTDIDLA